MTARAQLARQMRLPEVGEAGQRRLAAAEVELHTEGFARSIELAYLRRAGVEPLQGTRGGESALRSCPGLGLRHAAAREIADGAMSALASVRIALEIG